MARRELGGVRVERHPLGPRLFVAGFRLHEWHLGLTLLAACLAAPALRGSAVGLGIGAAGLCLFVRDCTALSPSRRDTPAWRLAPHGRPLPLRPAHRADWLPSVAGTLAGLVGALNVASALTPVGSWASGFTPFPHGRAHVLMQLLPEAIPRTAHA